MYFVILFGFNFQFTVSAVELGVSRRVAKVVLAAQFCGDLIKSLFQFVELIADVDHPAASCFGEFMHFAFPGVGHANAKITATIGAEQDIDDGIGFLGGLDGIFDFELAAFVLAVGEQNHGLAPYFLGQHFIRRKINRVVQHGAGGIVNGYGAATKAGYSAAARDAAINFHFVERGLQTVNVARVILHQFGLNIEVHHERLVLVGKNLAQECATDLFFHVEDS